MTRWKDPSSASKLDQSTSEVQVQKCHCPAVPTPNQPVALCSQPSVQELQILSCCLRALRASCSVWSVYLVSFCTAHPVRVALTATTLKDAKGRFRQREYQGEECWPFLESHSLQTHPSIFSALRGSGLSQLSHTLDREPRGNPQTRQEHANSTRKGPRSGSRACNLLAYLGLQC